MQLSQFFSRFRQITELFPVCRIRYTREIYLQEFLVAFAIRWAMKHGIDIVEEVLGIEYAIIIAYWVYQNIVIIARKVI